jgi:hypothetical protein
MIWSASAAQHFTQPLPGANKRAHARAAPFRPIVRNGYERKFAYVFGAVSPIEVQMDW